MKRFILSVFFLLIALPIISEIVLRKIPNDYQYKADYLKDHGEKIETLILGSSHTFTGLNPHLFSSETFNAAHSAQSLDLDYKIIEKYKSGLPNLNTIIIPISYFSFVSELNDFSEKKLKYYAIYWRIDTGNKDLNKKFEIFSEPIDVNYTRIKNYYVHHKTELSIDEKGYIKNRYEPEWNDSIYAKNTSRKHRFNLNSTKVQQKIRTHYNNLERLIKEAQSKNIQVILLSTPTTDLYKDYVIKTPQYYNLSNNILRLSKHKNVTVIDYFTNNHDFKFSEFKNSDHLNAKGADKLTSKVDSILNKNSQ